MAVSLRSVFGISGDVATNGVWVNFGGGKVLIGFMGEANKNFVKAVETATRPYKRDIEKSELSDEDGREMLAQIIANGVVYDWKGFEEPYSKEACLAELRDRESLLLQEVQEMAKRLSTFRQKEVAIDSGNSAGAS